MCVWGVRHIPRVQPGEYLALRSQIQHKCLGLGNAFTRGYMLIGIISDSHGNNSMLQKALLLFENRHVEAVVHCGDICDISSLHLLTKHPLTVWLTAGNMDWGITNRLASEAHGTNVVYEPEYLEMHLNDGTMLAATHGNDQNLTTRLTTSGRYRYICLGHSHRASDTRKSSARVICPGALSGPRYPAYPTCALLNTKTDNLQFFNLAHTPPVPASI